MITFAGADDNVCGKEGKRLRQSQAADSGPPRKYVHPFPQVRASEMDPELRQLGYKKTRGQLANVSLVAFGLYLR